tara:strand:- start:354 stop:815 length:462 start_codon:yes stop_codon:yes gene_type:complete
MKEQYLNTSLTPLAFYDPQTSCWKMSQDTLLLEQPPLLQRLPDWGTTQNGALFELATPEHLINARDSLYGANLPTPVMNDATRGADNSRLRNNGKRKSGQSGTLNLAGAIALLPTATARDYKDYGENVNWQRIADRSGLHGVIMNQQLDDGKQ